MKMLDSENARLGRELVELQGRVALGERAEKEGRWEALGLRQKLLKGEANLEAVRQEVTRWWADCLEEEDPQRQSGSPGPSPVRSRWGLQCWSHSARSLPRTGPCSPLLEILPQV